MKNKSPHSPAYSEGIVGIKRKIWRCRGKVWRHRENLLIKFDV